MAKVNIDAQLTKRLEALRDVLEGVPLPDGVKPCHSLNQALFSWSVPELGIKPIKSKASIWGTNVKSERADLVEELDKTIKRVSYRDSSKQRVRKKPLSEQKDGLQKQLREAQECTEAALERYYQVLNELAAERAANAGLRRSREATQEDLIALRRRVNELEGTLGLRKLNLIQQPESDDSGA